jgi:cytidyltransferase-like protein
MNSPKQVIVSGGFDDIKSRDLRFLEAASKLGGLSVLLWPDAMLQKLTGRPPKFPLAERRYFLNAVRYVSRVIEADGSAGVDTLPKDLHPDIWADVAATASPAREAFARENGIARHVFKADELSGFPEPAPCSAVVPTACSGAVPPPAETPGGTSAQPADGDAHTTPGRKKVIVTGSYDWFHSGHVRFLEEVSAYGDLYVVVGHDANIRLLKGEGHPLIPQDERRYVVGSIKFVKQALVSTGEGWLDADPEIKRLKPDIYAVNEDGDKGGKREYCQKLGIEYLVLQRTPAPGLPRRSSTDLRGF